MAQYFTLLFWFPAEDGGTAKVQDFAEAAQKGKTPQNGPETSLVGSALGYDCFASSFPIKALIHMKYGHTFINIHNNAESRFLKRDGPMYILW